MFVTVTVVTLHFMKIIHLELQQFGHELLDSLGIFLQRGAKSPPAGHDGVHLGPVPAKDPIVAH